MDERADEGAQQGAAVKRRGILAAAAALVVGMMAKQAAQPAEANDGVWQWPYTGVVSTVSGGSAMDIQNNGPNSDGITIRATRDGIIAKGESVGVQGSVNFTGTGVVGGGGSVYGAGVKGISQGATRDEFGSGVYGTNTFGSLSVGVFGNAANGYGVFGQAGTDGYGVTGVATNQLGLLGQSDTGTAVRGQSGAGFPIIGIVSGSGSATNMAAGVLGLGTAGPGVQGQSTTGHGLVGTTNDAGGHAGLVGNANNAGGVGLMGIAPGYGTQSVGKAGVFYGNVEIHGTVTAPVQNTAVKHAGDNSYRTLYSVASPEGWFEDVGKGTLAGSKAEIKLDLDFAALVHTDDYHVFLTPYGPLSLYVAEQTTSGFTVMATPSGATGTGGPKRAEGVGTFSWRVMAKRKDIASERLAKVPAPTAPKVPTAFTIPETPEVKPPIRKP